MADIAGDLYTKFSDSSEKGVPKSQDHVHLIDGTSMNADGTVHDNINGTPILTKPAKKFLENHN